VAGNNIVGLSRGQESLREALLAYEADLQNAARQSRFGLSLTMPQLKLTREAIDLLAAP